MKKFTNYKLRFTFRAMRFLGALAFATLSNRSSYIAPPSLFAQENYQEVTVGPGDTMWNIANKYLKDPQKWPEIVKLNNLPTSDPTIALPGTRIKIPVTLIKEEYRTAVLVKVVPDVRYKRRDEEDFKEAQVDMVLRYEDSLRTMKGAQARVKFPSAEIVQINENSYVVLKPEKISQEVQLLGGEVRAARAKVIMPGGTIVKPKGTSEYKAKVRDDESEVVFVYKGEVNVTAKGKTVHVKEGFGTQVPKSAPPIEPMPLKEFKDFDPAEMPSAGMVKRTQVQTGEKPIKFTPPKPAIKEPSPIATGKSKAVVSQDILKNYHVQMAKDDQFQQIVVDKTEATAGAFDVKKQNIPDGTYYMRVAFLDALGMQGPYSVPTMIVKDTSPPVLTEIRPDDGDTVTGHDASVEVSGTAKDAVMVAVDGQVVFLNANGHFSALAYLKPGPNAVKILARDGSGNETVVIRHVTYSK